jgi:hypothetical protein
MDELKLFNILKIITSKINYGTKELENKSD